MSTSIKISDGATRELSRIHRLFGTPDGRRGLMGAIGVAAELQLKAWFEYRDDTTENKQGFPRSHIWKNRIAATTAYDPARTTTWGDTATVVVADPSRTLAAKIHGATILPTGGRRFLSIPMNAEAYAIGSPGAPGSSRIAGLFVIAARGGIGNGAYLARRDGGGLTFFYRLVAKVTVPADPLALPPAEKIGPPLVAAAQEYAAIEGKS